MIFQRRMLLNLWIAFEKERFSATRFPDSTSMQRELERKLPQQVKKRRRLYPEDPADLTMEEYIDYLFPEDEEEQKKRRGVGGVSKLLAMARQWKEKQATVEQEQQQQQAEEEAEAAAEAEAEEEPVAEDQDQDQPDNQEEAEEQQEDQE